MYMAYVCVKTYTRDCQERHGQIVKTIFVMSMAVELWRDLKGRHQLVFRKISPATVESMD
jgi:hypothetical protein